MDGQPKWILGGYVCILFLDKEKKKKIFNVKQSFAVIWKTEHCGGPIISYINEKALSLKNVLTKQNKTKKLKCFT